MKCILRSTAAHVFNPDVRFRSGISETFHGATGNPSEAKAVPFIRDFVAWVDF